MDELVSLVQPYLFDAMRVKGFDGVFDASDIGGSCSRFVFGVLVYVSKGVAVLVVRLPRHSPAKCLESSCTLTMIIAHRDLSMVTQHTHHQHRQ